VILVCRLLEWKVKSRSLTTSIILGPYSTSMGFNWDSTIVLEKYNYPPPFSDLVENCK